MNAKQSAINAYLARTAAIRAKLEWLQQLPQDRLWALWDEHFPRRPRRVHRRYLEARLAYRLQEIALGGLPPSDWNTQHRLFNGFDA